MAEAKPTQRMVDELLAVRNDLGRVAVDLEEVLRSIPGYQPVAAQAFGEARTETAFFAAIAALTRDLRGLTDQVGAGVKALSDSL